MTVQAEVPFPPEAPAQPLPQIVSAGEALTDLVREGGDTWRAHPGGAGWNAARACASLGVPSAFAGSVGQDNFGDDLWTASAAAGLDLRFLQRSAQPTLLAVVYQVSPPAYRFLGENSADLAFDPGQLPPSWLGALRWLHVGGISLARPPLAGVLVGLIEAAKAAGAKVSFDPNARISHRDPGYRPTLERVARLADLLKFSDEDLAFFFPGQTEDDALRALRGWNPRAPIVVTRGAQGASLYQPAGRLDLPAAKVQVADTVGAGDALCAGLLTSAVRHAPPAGQTDLRWPDHLRYGLRAAAAACARAGAYAPTPEDVAAVAD